MMYTFKKINKDNEENVMKKIKIYHIKRVQEQCNKMNES